jgi:hypothetical protein
MHLDTTVKSHMPCSIRYMYMTGADYAFDKGGFQNLFKASVQGAQGPGGVQRQSPGRGPRGAKPPGRN